MVRARNAPSARRARRKVMARAKGYRGAKSRTFRAANEQVMHAMADSYSHRRARKGDFRRLWITRINAAARQNGMSYSRFVAGLNSAGVEINRKMLADLAVNDPEAFSQLVKIAQEG
ncbi:MAG: 50S ribosomal protein L20 [bacterium]|nr:50S ribosomal protein L20 [bacterium]MXX01364.1 50S ribosomal protein L20 [Acidimicrobiia bacterium]MDE0601823.1 50S ribosomal protein L20 [bacterium]MDE0674237.1 50S ribosomal protein L20 [bacterium]MXX46139.1 50S ribosomal protein L20 [Acidimicrobiia bacterium]